MFIQITSNQLGTIFHPRPLVLVTTVSLIEAAYQNDTNDFVFQMNWYTFAVLVESFELKRYRNTIGNLLI